MSDGKPRSGEVKAMYKAQVQGLSIHHN